MASNNLARLKSQLPQLPRQMREELDAQIEEIEFRAGIAREGISRQSAQLRRANAEIAKTLDAVGRTLEEYQSLPPTQQRALAGQIDLVLDNSRSVLQAAHEETMRHIRTASSARRQRGGFFDEFVDELTSVFLKRE